MTQIFNLLLTREEAADILRISVVTLDRLTKNRQIPSINFGRRVMFQPTDIVGFVAAHRRDARE